MQTALRLLVILACHGRTLAGPAVEPASQPAAEEHHLLPDHTRITTDLLIRPGIYRIPDGAGDGAIQIVADHVTVDFQGAELVGASADQSADAYAGTGVVVCGANVTIKNLTVRGYKIGIHALRASGLVLEDVDVSGNFRQRLRSTPDAEDTADWLYPHDNDDHQWVDKYGAGLYIEHSDRVTVRRVRARDGQNGIVLDRVNQSVIDHNDCSFLSGWGLAMWRSSHNLITRNRFDFCIRGYSHGVYNRGQDSAGILMFEQCNHNIISENSATHCGDGLFGFGGRESLDTESRTGNNGNLILNNDFSYAAAHGIEMTFSFDNRIIGNRLVGNAICGIWGGYSQNTFISQNIIETNGDSGYGLERGGINIEHGYRNTISNNAFSGNTCGIHLWSDEDRHLMEKPWIKANHKGSTDNDIIGNTFHGDELAIQLRQTKRTRLHGNRMTNVGRDIEADKGSEAGIVKSSGDAGALRSSEDAYGMGTGATVERRRLRGRDRIIVTEWGTYDFIDYAVFPEVTAGGPRATLQVLGPGGKFQVVSVDGEVQVSPMSGELPGTISVSTTGLGMQVFELRIDVGEKQLAARGSLLAAEWQVAFFHWDPQDDPRDHVDEWVALIAGSPVDVLRLTAVDFKWGGRSPTAKVRADHFGTVATTTVTLAAGRYGVRTVSDDGIRVWIDGDLVIDDWTWHAPKEHTVDVDLGSGEHRIRIEHFEINGYAQLQFTMRPSSLR